MSRPSQSRTDLLAPIRVVMPRNVFALLLLALTGAFSDKLAFVHAMKTNLQLKLGSNLNYGFGTSRGTVDVTVFGIHGLNDCNADNLQDLVIQNEDGNHLGDIIFRKRISDTHLWAGTETVANAATGHSGSASIWISLISRIEKTLLITSFLKPTFSNSILRPSKPILSNLSMMTVKATNLSPTSNCWAKPSKIFLWFSGDFTKKGSLIEFLNQYTITEIQPDATIDYLNYDWTLNE